MFRETVANATVLHFHRQTFCCCSATFENTCYNCPSTRPLLVKGFVQSPFKGSNMKQSLFVAALLALVLSACGDTQQSTPPAEAPAAVEQPAAPAETPAADAAAPTEAAPAADATAPAEAAPTADAAAPAAEAPAETPAAP
jgi:hypothetical protein